MKKFIKTIPNFLLLLLLTQNILAKEITYSVDDGKFLSGSSVYLKPTQKLTLQFDIQNAKKIKWYQIIPDISKFYKNSNYPWEENSYKWVGYGKIDYKRVEIKSFRDSKKVILTREVLEANRLDGNYLYNSKLGSFWFEAEATLKSGKVVKSKGIRNIEKKGLSPKVFRVSYMLDKTYIGYLTTFFNVPGIFGSMPYQSRNYIGVDCADVLVATTKIMNHEKNTKNYDVSMLVDKFNIKVKLSIDNGKPDKLLQWGIDFNKGDFIAVNSSPDSKYYHIGMLYGDENNNGILDEEDTVINAGPEALHIDTLVDGAFKGSVAILENKDVSMGIL